MNPRLARLLVRLYPRAWRERYGAEFAALLETGRGGLRAAVNVIWSALGERIFPTVGGIMNQPAYSFGGIVKMPSAFVPMAMSLTALAMLGGVYLYGLATGHGGLVREPDEGAAAHIWQLLMAGQMPVLLFFAVKWLPRAPRQALYVLALQVGAALSAMAPVYFLHL
jgi:hypothetical protein